MESNSAILRIRKKENLSDYLNYSLITISMVVSSH